MFDFYINLRFNNQHKFIGIFFCIFELGAVDRHSLSQNGASVSTSDRRSSSRSVTGTNGGGASSSAANRYHHQSRNGGRPGTGVGHSMHPSSGTTDTTPTSLSSDSATETETTVNEGRVDFLIRILQCTSVNACEIFNKRKFEGCNCTTDYRYDPI